MNVIISNEALKKTTTLGINKLSQVQILVKKHKTYKSYIIKKERSLEIIQTTLFL